MSATRFGLIATMTIELIWNNVYAALGLVLQYRPLLVWI